MGDPRQTVEIEPGPWDLGELLPAPTPEVIAERFAALEEMVAEFEARRPELVPEIAPERLLEILREYESVVEEMTVLGAYGGLWFAADTGSDAALTYRNRVTQLLAALENRVLFFTVWWKGLGEAVAVALLPGAAAPDYRHYLLDLRRSAPFTLEERSEQIVNLKDANGIQGVLTLYSMLTNRLEFRIDEDGEELAVTRDELMSRVFSPTAERRATAYRELYRVFAGEAGVLAQIYANRVRDWYHENVELRGFASPIAVRNHDNDLPDAAVETLLTVVGEHAALFQRYFRLKASWLGNERLSRYDLYAPLAISDRRISYGDGVRLVLETFADFDPAVAAAAERVFAERHIDSEIRHGKKGGAFCATVLPQQAPWVLVNYTGRLRDAAVLAHELGHAVHSLLAADHSVLTQHPSLPLAETASVFAEMLLTDRLLEREKEPLVRREILASAVDDIYATVLRQTFFVRFELAAHRAILAGAAPEEIQEIYLRTLSEQFGDSVEVPPEFRHEWVSVPHFFHTPFYCYAYSFGQLLVLALYERYLAEGSAFVPAYLELLAAGGSAAPQEILSRVGIDPAAADFWRGGFAVVERMIDELEGLEVS